MKKNITINLFGLLYAIDEDAYELLKKYEDNIRAYFAKQEGGEEIADDIERRVAELLEEYKTNGVEAISIGHVQDVIRRIGNPEQMEYGGKEDSADTSDEESFVRQCSGNSQEAKKKLFRDPNDKMLGGVISGIAHYFGCDALPLRLLIAFLCIFTSGSFLLVYIILWIIVPEARTAEDFLRMNGRMVTPEGIGQTVMDGQNGENLNQPVRRHGFDRFLAVLMLCLKVVLYIIGFCFFLVMLMCLLAAVITAVVGLAGVIKTGSPLIIFVPNGMNDVSFVKYMSDAGPYFWILISSCIVVCGIPIYCMVHHVMRLCHSVDSMSAGQRVIWMVVWFISILAIVFSGIIFERKIYEAQSLKRIESNAKILSEWVNLEKECCVVSDSVDYRLWHSQRKHYDKGEKFRDDMVLHDVAPGVYRLSTEAYADEDGAYLYAYSDDDEDTLYSDIEAGDPKEVMPGNTQVTAARKNNQGKAEMITLTKKTTALPTVSIEKIRVLHRGDLHFGIIVNKDDDLCKTLLYNRKVKIKCIESY